MWPRLSRAGGGATGPGRRGGDRGQEGFESGRLLGRGTASLWGQRDGWDEEEEALAGAGWLPLPTSPAAPHNQVPQVRTCPPGCAQVHSGPTSDKGLGGPWTSWEDTKHLLPRRASWWRCLWLEGGARRTGCDRQHVPSWTQAGPWARREGRRGRAPGPPRGRGHAGPALAASSWTPLQTRVPDTNTAGSQQRGREPGAIGVRWPA